MAVKIALQLYTLRREMENDFLGVLEKVAELGYNGVEFADYGGYSASELKEHLDRLGLEAAGSHVGLELLKNKLDEVIEYNLTINNKYIVCPWSDVKTKEDIINLAAFLKEAGKKCKEKGLQLCYHNHAHEFNKADNEYLLDILYSSVPSGILQTEVDTYWVKYAGADPLEYLKKYSGRTPLIHIKDMADSEEREYAEIGNGTIDIKALVLQAEKNGAEWAVVEQDECRRPPLESVKISIENLKKMNLV